MDRYCSGLTLGDKGLVQLCEKHEHCLRWIEFQKAETNDRIFATMIHPDACIRNRFINYLKDTV